jgi:cytochrome b subunit of formate dehydrogenase
MTQEPQRHLRFLVSDRVLHLLLLISFTILAITGLPQKYADAGWAVTMIRAMGGIEQTRVFHHTAAVVLILVSLAHAVQVGYRIYVVRKPMTMLPTLGDIADFFAAIKYNAGLSQQRPNFPRYNFIEKVEYWAVVWGTILMTVTGYVLWNPILVTNFLPGEVVPAAKIAHGMEAVLAVLSIVTWHFYFVHFANFNKAIFNGYITEHELAEDHAAELAAIRQGKVWRPPSPEVRYRRLRVYVPLATVFLVISVVATWRWLTAEVTAITTVPRIAAQEDAYQPVSLERLATVHEREPAPTPLRVWGAGQEAAPPTIPHGVAGDQAQCALCHAVTSLIRPAPSDHRDFAEDQCLTCHVVGEPRPTRVPATATPVVTEAAAPAGMPAVPHAVDGAMAQCVTCHQVGSDANPMPENHGAYTSEMCLMCHQPQAATPEQPTPLPTEAEGTPTPSAGASETPAAAPASGMPAIPHTISGAWAQCSVCHLVDGGMIPMPASHAAFTETQCTSCHLPEGGSP